MEEKKHSGLGIASFVTSLSCVSLSVALITTFAMAHRTTPGGLDENSPLRIVLSLGLSVSLLGCFLALGLGIGGLFHENRKKLFAILGTILAAGMWLFALAAILYSKLSGNS